MKKLVLMFLIALFFTANSSGGENISSKDERILLTPSDRLIGHWSNELEENYYYGKLTEGIGSYIIVSPDGNIVANHQYKIISQYPEGENIVVQLLFSNGDKREESYIIAKDGMELKKTTIYRGMEVITLRYYVDDKENP